jgi:hypothetical protein
MRADAQQKRCVHQQMNNSKTIKNVQACGEPVASKASTQPPYPQIKLAMDVHATSVSGQRREIARWLCRSWGDFRISGFGFRASDLGFCFSHFGATNNSEVTEQISGDKFLFPFGHRAFIMVIAEGFSD